MTSTPGPTIFLFDVDGTLTQSRQNVSKEMWGFLRGIRERESHDSNGKKVALAVVSGSDYVKILEQLGGDVVALHETFDYVFTENGLVGRCGTNVLPEASILKQLGEEKLQDVINFCLEYLGQLRIPIKRGNFIEFRKGMLNVSPIGRSCSQAEREQFVAYEQEHPVRVPFVEALRKRFADYGLTFAIGGQISIDIFPNGWDKTYCLRYLTPVFKNIHFFGDRTSPGGNDYEIFEHPATIGHTVESPEHTQEVVSKLLK